MTALERALVQALLVIKYGPEAEAVVEDDDAWSWAVAQARSQILPMMLPAVIASNKYRADRDRLERETARLQAENDRLRTHIRQMHVKDAPTEQLVPSS